MDTEDVEDFLLVRQQREGFRVEGIALQAKMGADGWRQLKFSSDDYWFVGGLG